MSKKTFAVKLAAVSVYAAATLYVHLRGKVRHGLWRQITDHSTLLAPYTTLINLRSAVPNQPVLDVEQLPELAPLQQNWEMIRDEALQLYDAGHIGTSEKYNDLAFNTFFKKGWKRFYLKWYDDFLPSAQELCPKTVDLVRSIPSVNAALFVVLSPRSQLGAHRDPFAGSLRYHLGLLTPNSENCQITIDGTPHAYYDGKPLLFDETYIHNAVNDTDLPRLILFCDVTRPVAGPIVDKINAFVIRHVVKATAAQNVPTEKVGAINRLSSYVHALKTLFTALKNKNMRAYYIVKKSLIALAIYKLFIARYLNKAR